MQITKRTGPGPRTCPRIVKLWKFKRRSVKDHYKPSQLLFTTLLSRSRTHSHRRVFSPRRLSHDFANNRFLKRSLRQKILQSSSKFEHSLSLVCAHSATLIGRLKEKLKQTRNPSATFVIGSSSFANAGSTWQRIKVFTAAYTWDVVVDLKSIQRPKGWNITALNPASSEPAIYLISTRIREVKVITKLSLRNHQDKRVSWAGNREALVQPDVLFQLNRETNPLFVSQSRLKRHVCKHVVRS